MIYIIITTCIENKDGVKNKNHREKRYNECISQLLYLINDIPDIKPIIVENNSNRKTYLNNFNCEVCYTDNNKYSFPHKAINELLDIKHIIDNYQIKDDDYIIKLTGRYKLLNSNFIQLVKNNINNYDAFVKFFNVCTKEFMYNDCVLGLFAIKCKYLKAFNYALIKSPECEFADYIRKNINENKLKEIDTLELECCFADDLRVLIV
jgi:hypothetical protein